MTEIIRDSSEEINQVVLDRNYLTSANVRARFALNQYAEPPADLEKKAVNSLGLARSDLAIYDIGAADGNFLYRLREDFELKGPLIGVEPNSSQYAMHELWQTPVEMKLIKRALNRRFGYSSDETELKKSSHLAVNPLGIELYEGRAHDLSLLSSSSADCIFAMFMMYHLSGEQRAQAFSEFKRVLKPEGAVIIGTSGAENKQRHREFESAIARQLGENVIPPKPMNVGFTTEKAIKEVAQHFKHAYIYRHDAHIVIDSSEESIEAYYNSIRSLRDQFDPIPSESDFDTAMYATAGKEIYEAVNQNGIFTDTLRRSVIIASDGPLDEKRLHEQEFKRLLAV